MIGGEGSNDEFVYSVERYDPSTNAREEKAMAPMPTTRSYVGTAVLDGKLYVAGGMSEAEARGLAASSSIERYDPATNAWEEVAPATARISPCVALL